MATYTAREIAARIRRPAEDVGDVALRIQNWTKQGLIAIEEKNPGTGNSRRYSEDALLQIMLLSMVVDSVGASATQFAKLFAAVGDDLKESIGIARKRADRGNEIGNLLISRSPGEEQWFLSGPVLMKDIERVVSKSQHDVHLLVNLDSLFAKLKGA